MNRLGRALLLVAAWRGARATACLTHVVVAAAHYGPDNASQALRREVLALQRAAADAWLRPASTAGRSLFLVVENDAAERSRAAVEAATLAYARNEDYGDGFGFELGAWRWAVARALPAARLCDDAVVYLTQDSLVMNAAPIGYPPPRSLNATRVYDFDGSKPLFGVPRAERHWQRAAASAFARVAGAPDAAISARETFAGCYGPNLVGTWRVLRALGTRGVFDMMRVRTKLDEQRSERVLGLFLARDVRDTSSLGGDYRRAELAGARAAGLPFRKVRGSRARPKERWHP